MKKYLLLLLFSAVASTAAADPDVLTLREPQFNLISPDDNALDVEYFLGSKVQEDSASATLFLPSAKDSFFIVGAERDETNYERHQRREGRILTSNIGKAYLDLGYGDFLDDNVLLIATLNPEFSFDSREGSDLEDPQINPTAVGYYFLSPDFDLHGGLTVLHFGSNNKVVPLGGADYFSPDHRFHVTAILPQDLKAAYKTSEFLDVFFHASYDEEEYRLTRIPSATTEDTHIGAGATVSPLSWLHVTIEGGTAYTHLTVGFAHESYHGYPYIGTTLGISF